MNSYYTPDPNTPIVNKVICLLLGVVFVFFLAFVHGIITAVNPIIYLGIVATVGFGLVFGVGYRILSKIAKVRDKKFIIYSATALILVGMYFSWSAYLSYLLVEFEHIFSFYLNSFGGLINIGVYSEIVMSILGTGAWEVFDIPISGVVLGVIWLAEIAIVVYVAFKILNSYTPGPFSERRNKWYTKYRLHDEYQSLPLLKGFSEIEGANVSEKIRNLDKGRSTRFGRISIFYMEHAPQGYLLYENMGRDSKGKKIEATTAIDYLSISTAEAKQIIDNFYGKKEFYFEY